MSELSPFQRKGEMSQVDAVLTVFRALGPGDWVSQQDLHAQVRDLTGTDVSLDSLQSASWQAGERLPRNGELGVDWHMGGYKRQDSVALCQAAEVRLDRAIKDLARLDVRTDTALRQPDLPAPNRHRMEHLHSNNIRQVALSARRKGKQRPSLPPGDGA